MRPHESGHENVPRKKSAGWPWRVRERRSWSSHTNRLVAPPLAGSSQCHPPYIDDVPLFRFEHAGQDPQHKSALPYDYEGQIVASVTRNCSEASSSTQSFIDVRRPGARRPHWQTWQFAVPTPGHVAWSQAIFPASLEVICDDSSNELSNSGSAARNIHSGGRPHFSSTQVRKMNSCCRGHGFRRPARVECIVPFRN